MIGSTYEGEPVTADQIITTEHGLSPNNVLYTFTRGLIMGSLTIITLLLLFHRKRFGHGDDNMPLGRRILRDGWKTVLLFIFIACVNMVFRAGMDNRIPLEDAIALIPRLFGFK